MSELSDLNLVTITQPAGRSQVSIASKIGFNTLQSLEIIYYIIHSLQLTVCTTALYAGLAQLKLVATLPPPKAVIKPSTLE